MFIIDLLLCVDLVYEKIFCCFLVDLQVFVDVFVCVWFKFIYCDMGFCLCYLGLEVLVEEFFWQDLVLVVMQLGIDVVDIVMLKQQIVVSGLSVFELVVIVWVLVFIFCGLDKCGGVNGVCICLVLQKDWVVNQLQQLVKVLVVLEKIQIGFNGNGGGRQVLLVDLIVLVGGVGIEQVVKVGGYDIQVLFIFGCIDVSQEQIDVELFVVFELYVDGFCNYFKGCYSVLVEVLLIDKVQLFILMVLELIVLVGGLCVLGVNMDGNMQGVLIDCFGMLSNDFFINLLDMCMQWKVNDNGYESSGVVCWIGSCVDLVFGFNLVL